MLWDCQSKLRKVTIILNNDLKYHEKKHDSQLCYVGITKGKIRRLILIRQQTFLWYFTGILLLSCTFLILPLLHFKLSHLEETQNILIRQENKGHATDNLLKPTKLVFLGTSYQGTNNADSLIKNFVKTPNRFFQKQTQKRPNLIKTLQLLVHNSNVADRQITTNNDDGWSTGDDDDLYIAQNDDTIKNSTRSKNLQLANTCRRPNWSRNLYINCNNLHEFDIPEKFLKGVMTYLTSGGYREVYRVQDSNQSLIFKSYYWGSNFTYHDLEFMRIDALVNERLSWSPRIVDIYGFCGAGMINEAMLNGDLYEKAAPYGHHGKGIKHANNSSDELVVSNNLSGIEKLNYALQMAEAVSILHSYRGGEIVHQDIKPAQFLLSSGNKIKLNDFNRAEILSWDVEQNRFCPFYGHGANGVWRSPEEYNRKALNEQIDVWSLGTSMYVLLTGVKPHHKIMYRYRVLAKLIKEGKTPFIDPRFENHSLAEKKLIEGIRLCWEIDPSKRITVFGLVVTLREAVALVKHSE